MPIHTFRRAAALAAVLLLCAAVPVYARNTTTITGITSRTASTTATTTEVTTTTDTTATTETTEATTTTTTAKPTDPYVDSVSYVTESMQLPKGAVLHGGANLVDGRNGQKALSFDGNSNYIEVNIRKMSSPFTLSLWVNWQGDPVEDTVGQRVFSFLQEGTENNLSFTPLLKRSDIGEEQVNGMVLFASCYKNEWLRNDLYYPSNESVSDMLSVAAWHHLALTVDGDKLTMYIDGVQWRAETLPFTFEDLKADTLLLGSAVNGSCLFKGLMQDVKLYAGALTPQQVGRIAQDADPFDATVLVIPAIYTPAPLQSTIQTVQLYSAKTLIEDGKQSNVIVKQQSSAAFWEAPYLNGGQSITGVMTVDSRSKHLVNIRLQSIGLPQQGTPEWEYLSGVYITVNNGTDTIYSGPYTELTPSLLQMDFADMSYGRRHVYSITISRPLTAATPPVSVSVPWDFGCEVLPAAENALPENRPLTALLIVLPLSAALLGLSLFFAITHRQIPVFTVWNGVAVWCRKQLIGPLTQKTKDLVRKIKKEDE